jgi:putative colanic acid biosynthesis acetyltransferase WcaF
MFNLKNFQNPEYNPGSFLKRVSWYFCSRIFFEGFLPYPIIFKRYLLILFGSKIGHGFIIKPKVQIKYPWFLEIGDHVWIGEGSWIDNIGKVYIGDNVCISQGVFFETGSHNFKSDKFDLIVGKILIGNNVWIGCKCIILPGAKIKDNSIIYGGRILKGEVEPDKLV